MEKYVVCIRKDFVNFTYGKIYQVLDDTKINKNILFDLIDDNNKTRNQSKYRYYILTPNALWQKSENFMDLNEFRKQKLERIIKRSLV